MVSWHVNAPRSLSLDRKIPSGNTTSTSRPENLKRTDRPDLNYAGDDLASYLFVWFWYKLARIPKAVGLKSGNSNYIPVVESDLTLAHYVQPKTHDLRSYNTTNTTGIRYSSEKEPYTIQENYP